LQKPAGFRNEPPRSLPSARLIIRADGAVHGLDPLHVDGDHVAGGDLAAAQHPPPA
jgi:hypothetical protein